MSSDLQQQLQATLGSDYRIERELGGGGMSRVFLAEERTLGRRVVVKVLSRGLSAALSSDRFEREIRVAAALQDPRIVPLLQAGHAGDLRYYTMPFVDGETLRARMDRGPLAAGEAIGILRDVLLALEYAHARGLVHRDIKPENVLLAGRTAVVTDFGIAKAIVAATRSDADATLTALGTVVGTPAYMAPEQAAGDEVDARTDLYAWGVIAYELLAGEHPFPGHTTAQALLAAHIAEVHKPLVHRRPDLPASLTGLVDRCLEKDAARRPPNAAAIEAELTAAIPDSLTTLAHPAPGRMLAPRGMWWAAAVVVLAGGGWWTWRRSMDREWARFAAVPEATRLQAAAHPLAAAAVLVRARRILPMDTALARATTDLAPPRTIRSTPSGATVRVRDYVGPDTTWTDLGTTPLTAPLPGELLRVRIIKRDGRTFDRALRLRDTTTFALDSAATAPPGMVWVGAQTWAEFIAFVGWVGPYRIPSFWLDQYEVTNRDWQKFVDAGGYPKSTPNPG